LFKIENLFYCPVKSISFTDSHSLKVLKNKGICNDRIFAFVYNLDSNNIKIFQNHPQLRKLNNFVTLKNSPELNQYNFILYQNKLILRKKSEEIISVDPYSKNEQIILSNKISQLLKKNKKINFLIDKMNPFFDTMPNNSISLINKNSINDLENKILTNIEFQRFRGNIYISGPKAWEERNWLGKTIKINNVNFLVSDEIPRCSATNLKPNTDNITINLPNKLKKTYDHNNMGVYLIPLSDGEISIDNEINLND
jgi:uncharacterized protein YcbX